MNELKPAAKGTRLGIDQAGSHAYFDKFRALVFRH